MSITSMSAGQQLLHYRLIEQIGEGGMGVVWKAEDTRLHRHVALKFVSEARAGDAEGVDRHLREARAASALNHPHICSIYDIGDWQGQRFIVMELLEGRPLDELIGDTPLAIDSAIELAIQATDALAAAHGKGIVHRDIKSSNLFVVDSDPAAPRLKMLDFGLAKLTATSSEAPNPDSVTRTELSMTKPGTLLGTIAYMSPEQALGKELDHRTDIFSLGVVLYEMITAARAFDGTSSAAVFDAILNRAPTAPVELNPQVPVELGRIVNRALEKDSALRYQSAADFGAELKRLRRDASASRSEGSPPRTATSTSRRWPLVLAALGLLVAALTTWSVLRSSAKGDSSRAGAGTESRTAPASSGGPSIAVLPFTNASGDPEQEYFSDGLTEDIITELSRYRELSVIARNSTERYKGSNADAREIGAALGTRYVLQGSVRKAGQRIRLSVQLSSAVDGRAVWGNNYESDLTAHDLFELQDELTQQVVNAIAGSYGALARTELPGARRRPPASLDSYDCVLRVYEYLQAHNSENHLASRDCLEKVVEDDPEYAGGQAWLAYLYAEEYHHRRNERPGKYVALDRALEQARESVRLDDSDHVAHGVLALVQFFRGEYESARIESYRTIEISPNNALWLSLIGVYLVQQEDFEGGMQMVRKAIALTPHPPPWIRMANFYEQYQMGRFAEALHEAQTIDMGGDDFRLPLFRAACYGQLGRLDEARSELDELRRLWTAPVDQLRTELIERQAYSPGLADHLLKGLAKAGLVEASASPTEP